MKALEEILWGLFGWSSGGPRRGSEFWDRLQAYLDSLGGIVWPYKAIWGPSWTGLGASWGFLRPMWLRLDAQMRAQVHRKVDCRGLGVDLKVVSEPIAGVLRSILGWS